MRHPERVDDQKNPLFPKMHVNDHKDQAGSPKPPPRNKMAIYENQPTAISLPVTMPPPPPLLSPPKYRGISLSGSSVCYFGGYVPPAGRLAFYAHNSTLPTLQLLPSSKFGNGQEASISQHNKPSHVSSTRNVDSKYPELEIFQLNQFRNDTDGNKTNAAADDSIHLNTQRHATRADALTSSSSTRNWQMKQSNHSSVLLGRNTPNKPAHNIVDETGLVGVGSSSSNKPQTQCEYREVLESQNVSKRKGSYLDITPAEESTSSVISPEDVTAIIGKEAFLRLRGEMIKHQKQFVEQVFELHRLIATQRLIARSRRRLLDYKHKMEKPSSLLTRNPRDAQQRHGVERRDDNSRLQYSSGYISDMFYIPPQKKDPFKVPRPNHHETHAGNSKPANTSPSIYSPPGAANHWLVPVLSPSEGLIYKPYPIPSAPSPPPIQMNPPKLSQTHQPPFQQTGIRPLPDIPFCIPPYPALSPSTSAFEHVGKAESYHHPRTSLPRSSLKSSWNFSTLGSGTVSCQVDTINQAKQGGDSTDSSSPPDKTPRNILPLFPEEPTVIAKHQESHSSEQQRKVIKVVPHPPTSVIESTARIMRSIWEERR